MQLLSWLDSSPAHYWFAAWTTFAAFGLLTFFILLFPREQEWWRNPVFLSAIMLIVLFAFRWPMLFDNRPYPDPDESQFIAGAMTLREDPLFWKSVDGTTHGPLTEWPLLVGLIAHGSLNFKVARIASLILVWLQLISGLLIFRRLFGPRIAGLLVLPLLAVNAFTQIWSFVAYCSEHVPNALLAVGCCMLVSAWQAKGNAEGQRFPKLFAAGALLGAIPFAKLQAAPIALVTIIGGVWLILTTRNRAWRAVGAFVGGAATVAILIVAIVITCGIWVDFFGCYIMDNLRYASANRFPPDRSFGFADAPKMFFELGSAVGGFDEFALSVIAFALIGLIFLLRFTSWHRRWAVLTAIILITSAFAAMAPGRLYLHYLQLIIFPAGLFGGIVAGALFSTTESASSSYRFLRAAVPVVFVICGLAPQLWWRVGEPQPFLGRYTITKGALVRSAVSNEILEHARPGERLAIWGWMPMYWVETGLIQATRDGQTSRQIEPHPRLGYYRSRFMQDLLQTKPPVFVDAVGPGNFVYENRAESEHETFPELRDYIQNNYYLVRDLDSSRIYVRNDRL
ncbi:MAG TPA: hypothetical protein VFA58_02400 [Chthoniobacterales bacterium]|nr:hypothetical protein [Chthoniobacterales bacterium]